MNFNTDKIPTSQCKKYYNIVCAIENYSADNIDTVNGGFNAIGTGIYNGWNQGNDYYESSFEEIKISNSVLPLKTFVQYYELSELPNDCRYLYIINIHNVMYFENNINIGFKKISQKVLEDIKNNKAKLVLLMSTEGESGTIVAPQDFNILNAWINDLQLPAKNIHYINGNLTSNTISKQNTMPYNMYGVTVFETWNDPFKFNDIVDFKPAENQYLYLNYNRIPRLHRIYLLAELLEAGLFNEGLNSFDITKRKTLLQDNNFKYAINMYDKELLQTAQYIFNTKTQIIDIDTTNNLASNINIHMHESTFVDIVTETIVDPNSLFISEKLWKPIMIGKPFIVLGSNGMLSKLKEMGYKTYDKWFDETYDNTNTLNEKIKIIIKNINSYKDKSIDELRYIRKQMSETCKYNQLHFKTLVKDKYYDKEFRIVGSSNSATKPVLDILNSIYNNW